MEQQQNFIQTPFVEQPNDQVISTIRPPLPNPGNAVRPSVQMTRPPMPLIGQRPPHSFQQQQQGQRPPMPAGMRPPPPLGQAQSGGPMRPPPPRPQLPLGSIPMRPPAPPRPIPPSVSQSPSQNIINGYNNQPPTIQSPLQKMSIRTTMPTPPSIPQNQFQTLAQSGPVNSQTQTSDHMQVPTMPISSVSMRPPISQPQIPLTSMRPPIPQPPQIPSIPIRPPIPGQPPISIQNPVRPSLPIQTSTRPPMPPSVQSPGRPPIPMMNTPLNSSTAISAVRPPIPSGPPIPGMNSNLSQSPNAPPLSGHSIGPPVPSMNPVVSAAHMHIMPHAPNNIVAHAPTAPQTGFPPFPVTGYSQAQSQGHPQSQQTHGYPHQPQVYPQPHAQPQQAQGFSQSQPHGGYQQTSYNPGFIQGQAPLSITSTSHNLKEFYDEPKHLIKPNIGSEYFSSSLEKVPRNSAILGKARTPFGITVSFYPFGDTEKDRVAEVSGSIVRCRRCRTYLNPFTELIEQGSRWRCNICFLANEFPPNYDFDQVSQTNVDRKSHVELNNFVYDFTNAPVEYTVRPPQPPVFFFALEVTTAAVQSGLFAASCRVIQEQLDSIPNEDGRARVALVTFDQRIQFYKMTPNESSAKVLVVADAGDPFLPACSDLLVNLSECRSQLDSLLDQLPQMYSTPSKASSALGPVLRSAHMLLKSIGGKIVVICASLPTQFEGALKACDDLRLLGTPKESTLLQPANQFYKLFASEIVKDQICVDLFVAPPQLSAHVPIHVDLASLSGLAKYTGGKLHYYPEFGTVEGIASKFCSDLGRFLGQAHGFEAVLRIRASHGISLSAYHGSFFLRQTDLLSLPNVNPDHSFTAQASIDENLQGAVVCFQAALLHTTSRGERRIRVVNFSAPITEDVKEVFSNMNVNGIAGILTKMAVEKVMANRLEDAREAVLNKCSDVIAAFKTHQGLKANPNLLLPENMKNFPILLHSLIKSIALRSGSQTLPDLRVFYLTLLKTLSVSEIIGLLLPRFYAIHSMESNCGLNGTLPELLNLSAEKLERHGIFLLDNGFQQFLWIGSNVHPELLSMLFGTSVLTQIPSGRTSQLIPDLDNDWNRRLRSISENLNTKFAKKCQPQYFIIKEDSDQITRQLFMSNLIEDRAVDGSSPSYAQWLMEVNTRVNSASY